MIPEVSIDFVFNKGQKKNWYGDVYFLGLYIWDILRKILPPILWGALHAIGQK